MNPQCSSHRAGGEVSPVLRSPDEAARVLRLVAPPTHGPALALLLCDAEHRLLMTVVVDGATANGVGRCLDLVLGVAGPAGVVGLVVGIVRPRGGRMAAEQEAALSGVADRCTRAEVDLLDVLVVWPGGWRSVWGLAAGPGGQEDGSP